MLFLMGSTGPDWIFPWRGRDGMHAYSPDWIGYPICSDFLDKTSAAAVALEDHGVDNTCLGMVCDLGWDRADYFFFVVWKRVRNAPWTPLTDLGIVRNIAKDR